ncbi:calmodulin-binding receptor-like cytoplasmic kinase 3 [Actinidia rufa]|uniref:Calmodulin-binding receptor-like cytoplasmic kinase 3 n=1 Tax=Actinidia rufa TaxID=165716 RepID=A0A7J0FM42_9ERIC|nr:calmodulin-binding receptor-like cytoplasmic kinase 3 [Actinidia rufa]
MLHRSHNTVLVICSYKLQYLGCCIDSIMQFLSYYFADELALDGGRKVLHEHVKEETPRYNFLENIQPSEDRDAHKSLLTPKTLTIAIPGFFVLCCSLLCPCFQARRKTAHTVLSKDPVSMDSASSLEMNSVHEKIPGSPLRVPPSPSRFSMSPKLDRLGSIHLNMSQVIRATHNFSPSMMLGEGGFGTVYKAQLLDGQVVAIKRAKKVETSLSFETKAVGQLTAHHIWHLPCSRTGDSFSQSPLIIEASGGDSTTEGDTRWLDAGGEYVGLPSTTEGKHMLAQPSTTRRVHVRFVIVNHKLSLMAQTFAAALVFKFIDLWKAYWNISSWSRKIPPNRPFLGLTLEVSASSRGIHWLTLSSKGEQNWLDPKGMHELAPPSTAEPRVGLFPSKVYFEPTQEVGDRQSGFSSSQCVGSTCRWRDDLGAIIRWRLPEVSLPDQEGLHHELLNLLHVRNSLGQIAKLEFFETLRTEFSSEVELLAKIDHRNLVKLLGYLDKGNERLIITEYVPNGTLREHLDGKITDWKGLATHTNLDIIFTTNNIALAAGRYAE